MMYVEFIERDRWVPIEVFRHLGSQGSAWADGAIDRMVLQLGRTLRFGPRPSYMCFWEIPDIGRLDAWEEYFESAAAKENARSLAMHRTVNIDRAGLYDVLFARPGTASRLFVVEFQEGEATNRDAVRAQLHERAQRLKDASPRYLLERVGRLGSDSSHLCVWGVPSYVAAEHLIRAPATGALTTRDIGIYRDFGRETI